ncbi:hypothetical protein FQN49_000247 [Arthroderma sp. PD_2]|nr:hypothetical protein FQN49_000247 [Arthroderma sp. PD_2]
MAGWKDLPLELVHMILSYACYDDSDGKSYDKSYDEDEDEDEDDDDDEDETYTQLARLCRVSKTFRTCVRPLLYKRIDISPRYSSQSRVELLIRSLSENPDLAHLTRHVEIYFSSSMRQLSSFHSLLKSLPLLEELKIDTSLGNLDCPALDEDLVPYLKRLNIHNHRQLKWRQVTQWIRLPYLESLTVGPFGPDGDDIDRSTAAQLKTTTRSTVKSLSINLDAECSTDLDTVLSCCPDLKSLTCTISFSCEDENHHLVNSGNLSRIITRRLSTCLTTLSLKCRENGCIDPGGVMDLSLLANVRELEVDPNFLFSRDALRNPSMRVGVYAQLPSALVNLRITFVTEDAFEVHFGPRPSVEGTIMRRMIPAVFEPQSLNWLIEIAAHKPTSLPHLSHVHVRESEPSCRCGTNFFASTPVYVPDTVFTAFEEKEISLEAQMRRRLPPSQGRRCGYLQMTKPKASYD